MKLAVYTVSLPEYNVEESVALLKEMGYDAVEWRVDSLQGIPRAYLPANVDEYAFRYWMDNKSTVDITNVKEACLNAKKLCDEAGIEIVNLAPAFRGGDEALVELLEAAVAIGCKTIRGPMQRYDPTKPYWEQFEDFRSQLRHFEPFLQKYGVRMLIETHHGMLVSGASSAIRMLDGFDPEYFGVIYDPGNMVYEGFENYKLSFEMLGKYLAHVHVKNAVLAPAGKDDLGATKYSQDWASLKDGSADLGAMISALIEVGYDGALSVEDFSNDKPTREKLEENIAYLRQLLNKASAK